MNKKTKVDGGNIMVNKCGYQDTHYSVSLEHVYEYGLNAIILL